MPISVSRPEPPAPRGSGVAELVLQSWPFPCSEFITGGGERALAPWPQASWGLALSRVPGLYVWVRTLMLWNSWVKVFVLLLMTEQSWPPLPLTQSASVLLKINLGSWHICLMSHLPARALPMTSPPLTLHGPLGPEVPADWRASPSLFFLDSLPCG